MELIGTTLYFSKLTSDESEITKLVNTVKSHFPEGEIKDTINYLNKEGVLNN